MKNYNNHVLICEVKRLTSLMENSKNEMEYEFYKGRLACFLMDNAKHIATLSYSE